MTKNSSTVAAPKRRGRPIGSIRSQQRTEHVVKSNPYLDFLASHPVPVEPSGFSIELVLHRLDARTADFNNPRSLVARLAEAAHIPLATANDVVAGIKPFTSKMAVAVAKSIGCTTDELLNGDLPTASADDEAQFLSHYRSASPAHKEAIAFTLALGPLLELLPAEARDRVIASLVALYNAGAQELLAFLPSCLGAFQAKTGVQLDVPATAPVIFTPFHEFLGVYGPEQAPLAGYL